MMRRNRGFTLVELLIYGTILAIASGSILSILITLRKTQTQVTTQPTVQAQAQDALSAVAAFVRRAPICTKFLGCTENVDSAFRSASATSLSVYTSAAGASATFSTVNGALMRTQGTTSVAIVPSDVTMRYQYVLSPSLDYTMNASSDAYVWLDTVPATSLPAIVAVKITATVTRDDVSSIQSSIVRLRNSPKKVYSTN
jgi:type II secretory pathway pseudopilin PulG